MSSALSSWLLALGGSPQEPTAKSQELVASQVRQHLIHGLLIRLRDFRLAGKHRLTARRLLRQGVPMEGVLALQFAAARLLEPLGGAAVRLHFRHSFVPNQLDLYSIPNPVPAPVNVPVPAPVPENPSAIRAREPARARARDRVNGSSTARSRSSSGFPARRARGFRPRRTPSRPRAGGRAP